MSKLQVQVSCLMPISSLLITSETFVSASLETSLILMNSALIGWKTNNFSVDWCHWVEARSSLFNTKFLSFNDSANWDGKFNLLFLVFYPVFDLKPNKNLDYLQQIIIRFSYWGWQISSI